LPPSGIAIAAMLVCGYRVWPGIVPRFVLLEPCAAARPFDAAVGIVLHRDRRTIALGAASEAALAKFLVEGLVDEPAAFVREEQIIKFLLAGGP